MFMVFFFSNDMVYGVIFILSKELHYLHYYMAVCNIFSPLSNPTGNFLMFSNYTDDMNRYRVQDSKYRVAPSKFYAVDVDFTNVVKSTGIDSSGDLNIGIPMLFQNMYENWIAFSKNNPSLGLELYKKLILFGDNNINETEYHKRLFWSFLHRCGFIKRVSSDSDVSNIKYSGEISLESYDKHGGEGYGEIVCHIPSESNLINYHADFEILDSYINIVGDGGDSGVIPKLYIEGYGGKDDIPVPGELFDRDTRMTAVDSTDIVTKEEPTDSSTSHKFNSYKFNMIIVYYDIKQDGVVIESDIPMGVYFVGNFEDGNTTMSNEKTIYIQNKDVFGASTTYSLRICTRYTVNPNGYGVDTDIEVDPNDKANISILLSKMADNIDTMNEVLKSVHTENSMNKDLYNIFKAGQVNVPYIKVIGNNTYWFVNGKYILAMNEIGHDEISREFEAMKYVYDRNSR